MLGFLFRKTFSKNSKDLSFKTSKGFTLIELLVVVVILGILIAIAIPAYFSYINTAKITLANGALDSIRKTLESFHIDYQEYPAAIDFTTGKDNLDRTVFQSTLVVQINKDLFSIDSYVSGSDTYTLTARANDDEQTLMTLTPQVITY